MILIIDNYDSFTYNLYQGVAELGKKVEVIRNDQITVEELRKLNPDNIILSPGPGRPENAGICIDLIQSLKGEIPLLGVCLGHQAIATAFGGRVIQAPEIVHGKKERVFHQGEDIYKDMPKPFEAGRYHSLLVDRASLPSELKIQSETETGLIMGIRHVSLPIFGIQFHPESILTSEGLVLLKGFLLS